MCVSAVESWRRGRCWKCPYNVCTWQSSSKSTRAFATPQKKKKKEDLCVNLVVSLCKLTSVSTRVKIRADMLLYTLYMLSGSSTQGILISGFGSMQTAVGGNWHSQIQWSLLGVDMDASRPWRLCVWGWDIWQRRENFFVKRLVTRRNSNFLDKNRKFLKEHLKKGFLFSSKRIHFCENCVTHPTPSILYIRYTKKHLKDAAEDKQLQFSNSYSFVTAFWDLFYIEFVFH